MFRLRIAAVLACAVAAAAPVAAAEYPNPRNIKLSGWAELTSALGDTAMAHIIVTNRASQPDRFESALSPPAQHVSLQNAMPAGADPTLIAAGATEELSLSLSGINPRLAPEKRFPLVLIFERAGVIRVDIPLRSLEVSH